LAIVDRGRIADFDRGLQWGSTWSQLINAGPGRLHSRLIRGLEVAMIKLTFCLRRRPELSREEFQRYWYETHAPLVRKHAEVLGVRRYVQLHTVDHPMNAAIRGSRQAPEEYDGVAELWFDSLEAMSANRSDEAQAAGRALLEDERKFIDLARSPLWFAEEKVIIG
jgi:uncharacterized protein (TIGR02118 family)